MISRHGFWFLKFNLTFKTESIKIEMEHMEFWRETYKHKKKQNWDGGGGVKMEFGKKWNG